jgi:hypothetical protein
MLFELLFKLTKADKEFFLFLLIIAGIFLAVYLLMPIIKRKQYAESRENLRKREETFKANLKKLHGEVATEVEEESDE